MSSKILRGCQLEATALSALQRERVGKRFLSDTEVESEYGFPTAKTLRKWRLFGTGPQWLKMGGAVRYDRNLLEEYFTSCARGVRSQRETAHA